MHLQVYIPLPLAPLVKRSVEDMVHRIYTCAEADTSGKGDGMRSIARELQALADVLVVKEGGV